MKMNHKIAVAAALVVASPAFGQVRALYTGSAGLPTSNVPGQPGLVFNDGTSTQTAFGRPFVSPSGNLVGFRGDTETSGQFFDEVYVVAPINNPMAGFSLREGTAVGGAVDGRVIVNIDERVGLIDSVDGGQFAFTSQTRVGNTFSNSDGVFYYAAPDVITAAAPGQSIQQGGALAEGNFDSAYAAPEGFVGFSGGTTDFDDAVIYNSNVLVSEGTALAGAPAATATFEFGQTYFGENGSSYLTEARSFPSSRTVDTAVVDGSVVAVGGQIIPDSGFAAPAVDSLFAPNGSGMNEAGVWWARGSNVDGVEWALVDGDVVAATGDSVDGSLETWLEIDGVSADAAGNYIVLGVTSLGEQAIAYNGTTVLARQGDSIDLTGLEIRDFSVNDIVLSNAGDAVFAARLRTDAGANAGHSLLTVAVPEPATASLVAVVGGILLRRRR